MKFKHAAQYDDMMSKLAKYCWKSAWGKNSKCYGISSMFPGRTTGNAHISMFPGRTTGNAHRRRALDNHCENFFGISHPTCMEKYYRKYIK